MNSTQTDPWSNRVLILASGAADVECLLRGSSAFLTDLNRLLRTHRLTLVSVGKAGPLLELLMDDYTDDLLTQLGVSRPVREDSHAEPGAGRAGGGDPERPGTGAGACSG